MLSIFNELFFFDLPVREGLLELLGLESLVFGLFGEVVVGLVLSGEFLGILEGFHITIYLIINPIIKGLFGLNSEAS